MLSAADGCKLAAEYGEDTGSHTSGGSNWSVRMSLKYSSQVVRAIADDLLRLKGGR